MKSPSVKKGDWSKWVVVIIIFTVVLIGGIYVAIQPLQVENPFKNNGPRVLITDTPTSTPSPTPEPTKPPD